MSHKDDVFLKVLTGVLLGLVVFTIAIIILANSVGVLEQESVGRSIYGGQSTVAERIQPVGKVRVAGQAPPEAAAAATPAARSGQEIVQVGASTAETGTTEAAAGQASAAPAAGEGEKVYTTACAACHSTGAAGAPRVGDTGAWGTRIAQGTNALNEHAIKGFRAMPPKGGRLDLSDGAVVAAVAYMVENSN